MDKIKVGDKFNAYVKKGLYSKTLLGKEGAGKLSAFSPEKATKVTPSHIQTKISNYSRVMFKFEKIT